jgi:hypothetical protein
VLTALAVSGHIAYDVLYFFSSLFPLLEEQKILVFFFSLGPEPAVGGSGLI